MPVTFKVSKHPAELVGTDPGGDDVVSSPDELLARIWSQNAEEQGHPKCKELFQSSLPSTSSSGSTDWTKIFPQQNGFVHTVVDAYNHHFNLILRPDDVWVAILMQFNL